MVVQRRVGARVDLLRDRHDGRYLERADSVREPAAGAHLVHNGRRPLLALETRSRADATLFRCVPSDDCMGRNSKVEVWQLVLFVRVMLDS